MRSLTIVAVSAVLFACATGAPAAVVGVAGATRAAKDCPVTHCPKGAFLNGYACFVKRCIGVMCPKFAGVCPAGTHLGQQNPSDCCKDACVRDCRRPLQTTD
jgi:hypothetical protein